jgi:Fe2+ transport system protein B
MLNTLRYARALKNAGVGAQQAEAMAEALDAEITEQIASKADIERLEERLGNQIATLATETKADVQRLENQIATLATETKSDIRELATETKADNQRLDTKIDMLKYTIGFGIAVLGLILAALQVYGLVR